MLGYTSDKNGRNNSARSAISIGVRTALIGMLGVACATPALAEQDIEIEEILVHAQKREQSLHEVPISISVFDSKFLDDAHVETLFDLQAHTPGFAIASADSPARTTIAIRGVGTSSASAALESSVGVFVDGVFRQRQASSIGDIVDIESVEILRGPQGSLFGKNTSSGALQIRTVAPNTEEFGGYLEASGGNLDYQAYNGAINIPIVEGKLGARLSGSRSARDGYVDNVTTGNEINDLDRYSLRGQLLFTPNDSFSARVIFDYSEIDEVCCADNNIFDGIGESLPIIAGNVIPASDFDDNDFTGSIDPSTKIKEKGVSVELNWDVGGGTLTSITAYRDFESDTKGAVGALPLDFLVAQIDIEQDAFTQEIRFSSTIGDSITYTVGGFYFQQDLVNDLTLFPGADFNEFNSQQFGFPFNLTGGFLAFPTALFGDPAALADALAADAALGFAGIGADGTVTNDTTSQDQESLAFFAQADFELSKKLVLTTGIRWTKDEKEIDAEFSDSVPGDVLGGNDNPTLMPFVSPVFGPLGNVPGQFFDAPNAGMTFIPQNALAAGGQGLFGFATQDFTEELTDIQTTGVVRLSYFVTPDIMTYASYSTGFKSGGTNTQRVPRDASGNPIFPSTFDAETATSYEIGTKLSLLDRRLRINFAAYLTKFDDFQSTIFTGSATFLQNAGEIESKGVELEIFAIPNEFLTLNLGVSYNDASYSDFPNGQCILSGNPAASPDAGQPNFPGACDNTDNTLPNAPLWKANAGVQAQTDLTDAVTLYGRLDLLYNSEQEGANLASNDPNGRADSNFLTNLRLGLRFGETWDVALWANNLFDEDVEGAGGFQGFARAGSIAAFNTPPRFWGLTVKATF